jgi:protein disulfide-isomerase A6
MKYTVFAILVLFAGCALAGRGGPALYNDKSPIIQLNEKNFAAQVFGSEHVWLVEFYAPWCGHCKSLAPEYEKAANNLKGIVRLGAVNCDDDANQRLCGNYEVKGFPTIKLFPSKLTEVKGGVIKKPEDYNGARSAGAMANFALSKLPNFVSPVTSKNEEKFLSKELPKALLFTNKDKTSDLYKALAIDYRNRMELGEAKHNDKALVEKYNVKDFPTLLVLKDGAEPIKFEGKLGHQLLTKFLEPHAAPKKEQPPPASDKGAKKEKPAEPEPEPETGEVYEIRDQATFDKRCVNKGGLCAIAVLDIENSDEADHTKYITLLKKIGEAQKGKFRVMYLDGPAQTNFTKELNTPQQYPNLLVLNPRKQGYAPFMGAFDEEAITEFLEGVPLGRRKSYKCKLPSIVDQSAEPPKKPRQPQPEPVEEAKDKDEL